jgi:hypothetical protein
MNDSFLSSDDMNDSFMSSPGERHGCEAMASSALG